ncbi:hypothetical protein PspLS_04372 [Pyricularia sp. CBS 133598]|nr:hypothetical protein PspLS_04372 [Pyricularia sp. CBS 133598]
MAQHGRYHHEQRPGSQSWLETVKWGPKQSTSLAELGQSRDDQGAMRYWRPALDSTESTSPLATNSSTSNAEAPSQSVFSPDALGSNYPHMQMPISESAGKTSASGLGRACAIDLVAHGANVAVLDINPELGDGLVKELGADKARFFTVDVTDSGSIAKAVEGSASWAKETGKPFGGVIPAAGVGFPGLILDSKKNPLSLDSFDLVVAINLRGTIDLVRQCLPHIAVAAPDGPDGEHGVVIMIASSAAFDGQMGQTAYAASKGALASAALPMARDLSRHGIRVAVIAPGMFETAMTAAMSDKVRSGLEKTLEFPKRGGKPDEFAGLVRHIIENSMLNGVVVRLDGAARMPSKL